MHKRAPSKFFEDLSKMFHYLEEKSFMTPIFKVIPPNGRKNPSIYIATPKLDDLFLKEIILPHLKEWRPKVIVRSRLKIPYSEYETILGIKITKTMYKQLTWFGTNHRSWWQGNNVYNICGEGS